MLLSESDTSYQVLTQLAFYSGEEEAIHRFSRLRFAIGKILTIFDLQITQSFLARSSGLSVQEKKRKIDFQDGCHDGPLGFPIRTILLFFIIYKLPMLPTKFQVSWPFGSGEEAKNRFSRWHPWRPSWISDWNDFSYF